MRTVGICLGVGLVAIGCSSFATVPETSVPVDAGTSTSDASDAIDATTTGGRGCTGANGELCADFETEDSFYGQWSGYHVATTGLGSFGAIGRQTALTDGSVGSLKATLLQGSTNGGVTMELHTAALDDVWIEADVFIPTPSVPLTGQVTLLAIQRGTDTTTNVEANVAGGSPNGDSVVLSLYAKGKDDKSDYASNAFTLPFNRWTRLRLESALFGTASGHGSVQTVVDGKALPGISATLTRNLANSDVTRWLVGAYRYNQKTQGDFTVYFDNIKGGTL